MQTTTQAIYQERKLINLWSDNEKRPLFIVNKILNPRETISILTIFLPNTSVPGKFLALCTLKTSFDDLVEIICKKEDGKIINEAIQKEATAHHVIHISMIFLKKFQMNILNQYYNCWMT